MHYDQKVWGYYNFLFHVFERSLFQNAEFLHTVKYILYVFLMQFISVMQS